jgi:hypothetical protein
MEHLLEHLLEDLLLLIFDMLTLENNVACQRVCRNFHKLLNYKLSSTQLKENGVKFATPYSYMYYGRKTCIMRAIKQNEYKLALYELKRTYMVHGLSGLLKLALKQCNCNDDTEIPQESFWNIINFIYDNESGTPIFYKIKTIFYKVRYKKLNINECDNILDNKYLIYVKLLCALHDGNRIQFDELWSKAKRLVFGFIEIGIKIAKQYDKKFNDSYPILTSMYSERFFTCNNIISTEDMSLSKFVQIYTQLGITYPENIMNIGLKLSHSCISHNNIEIFKYLIENIKPNNSELSTCYKLAANRERLEFMEYIVSICDNLMPHIIQLFTYELHPEMIYKVYHDGYFTKQYALESLQLRLDYPYHSKEITNKIMNE